jgi:7-carboxy-7-deazaguanine synthase
LTSEIVEKVKRAGAKNVMITGGEPLMQTRLPEIIKGLKVFGFNINIETNGTFPISVLGESEGLVDSFIFDWKLSNSGMTDKMNINNFADLSGTDFVKFVISSRADYDEAVRIMEKLNLNSCSARFAFSPAAIPILWQADLAKQIINWLIEDRIWNVIVSLQLHKIVNVS